MTGEPMVDAGMREMFVTGTMHNRVRMLAASYLTKHLLTDWRVGLAWFEDCLIDWDPASNALNWQWVAGSGPDAAPFFRVFSPARQAERFDPDGATAATGSRARGAAEFLDAAPRAWNLRPARLSGRTRHRPRRRPQTGARRLRCEQGLDRERDLRNVRGAEARGPGASGVCPQIVARRRAASSAQGVSFSGGSPGKKRPRTAVGIGFGMEEADLRADLRGLGRPRADQRLGAGLGRAVGAVVGLAGRGRRPT